MSISPLFAIWNHTDGSRPIRNLVSLVEHEREWNFFQGKPVLTTEIFPCDLDTTSVALTVTGRSKEVISSVMDEMLNYVDKDGIVQVSHPFTPSLQFIRLSLTLINNHVTRSARPILITRGCASIPSSV